MQNDHNLLGDLNATVLWQLLKDGKTRNRRLTHCSCSKDKDSHTSATAANDTKRHRANVFTPIRPQPPLANQQDKEKTLGNQSKWWFVAV